jgi:hypothetical protein
MRVARDDRASSATGIRERCTQPRYDGKSSLTSKVVRPTAITISIRVNPRWSDTRPAAGRRPYAGGVAGGPGMYSQRWLHGIEWGL